MYIAKVNIETATRKYKPGEKITGQLSDADIAFLKKHNFIVNEGDFADAPDDSEEYPDSDSAGITPPTGGLQPGSAIPGITPPGADGDSAGGIEYKDEAALKKLNKDEIVEYAGSIGLSLDAEKLKADLIDAVLNYTEEKKAAAMPE
ncbi:MAG: hypothetical protein NC345_14065 [Lachnospira sp.]|nr:hypothetical protein [Lachnospira sp.]